MEIKMIIYKNNFILIFYGKTQLKVSTIAYYNSSELKKKKSELRFKLWGKSF